MMSTQILVLWVGYSIIDFVCGIGFGIFGHFFGLLCFPFLGIFRGILNALVIKQKKFTLSPHLISSIIGSLSYFFGMVIGAGILLVFIVPNSPSMQSFMGNALSTSEGRISGFVGSLVCGAVYIVIYNLCTLGASYVTSKLVQPKETITI